MKHPVFLSNKEITAYLRREVFPQMSWVHAQELLFIDSLNTEYSNSNKMSFLQSRCAKIFRNLRDNL
jgi:hypothetical protein